MEKGLNKACQWCLTATLLLMVVSCQKNMEKEIVPAEEIAGKAIPSKELKDFVQVNLVGDNDEYSPAHIDANLVNGWGITFPTSGPAWVSATGTGLSTVYTGDGNIARAPVTIPSPVAATGGSPTGVIFNGTTDFKLPNGNPGRFIFAGADGVIAGWNTGNAAIRMVSKPPGNVYLGIALASDAGNNFLYLANFAQGKIDVYDKNWQQVNKSFTDPDLPSGYSPFNIQNIGGKLYVMYAKVDPAAHEEEAGPGNGYVNIFNTDGSLMKRYISRGQLNAPWGIAKAPAGFWGAGNDIQDVILVGNFGDGHINAYDGEGNFLGQLRQHGNPIEIEGLWGISFAPSTSTAINQNWLYFAAGPDEEEHGLFGYIRK